MAQVSPLARFQQWVLQVNRNPTQRGFYPPQPPFRELIQRASNPLCGDEMRLQLLGNNVISSVRFDGEMSAITLAAADTICRMLEGQTPERALQLLSQATAVLSATPSDVSTAVLSSEGDVESLGVEGVGIEGLGVEGLGVEGLGVEGLGQFHHFAILRDYPVRIKTAMLSVRGLQSAVMRWKDPNQPDCIVSSESSPSGL